MKLNNLVMGVAAGLALTSNVQATDLVVIAASHHFTHGEYNESNPGLGVFHTLNPKHAAIAGTYKNSYSKQTVYAGLSTHIAGQGMVQARVDYGLATGYQWAVVPMVVPVIEVHTKHVITRALIIPRVSEDTASAVGIQFRVRF